MKSKCKVCELRPYPYNQLWRTNKICLACIAQDMKPISAYPCGIGKTYKSDATFNEVMAAIHGNNINKPMIIIND